MAKISWSGPSKKWTLKEAASVSPMRIAIMDTRKRAELAQFLRNQFQTRLSQFAQAGEIGYALAKLGEDFEKLNARLGIELNPFDNVLTGKKVRKLSPVFANRSNPQNALGAYINIMQDFFNAKTSTLKGWRRVKEAQDYRLFGHDEQIPGRKVGNRQYYRTVHVIDYEMTDAERIVFWRTYQSLKKSGWTEINSFDSDVQRKFGTVWRTGKFDKTDIEAAYNEMLKIFDTRPESLRESAPGNVTDPTRPDRVSGTVDGLDGDYYDE